MKFTTRLSKIMFRLVCVIGFATMGPFLISCDNSKGSPIDELVIRKKDDDLMLAKKVLIDHLGYEIDLTTHSFPKKDFNYISIGFSPPKKLGIGGTKGIILEDGSITIPKIILQDKSGNSCVLTLTGGRGFQTAKFEDNSGKNCFSIPGNYRKLVITSEHPIEADGIFWSGYDREDIK